MKPNYIKAVVEAMKRQRVPMREDGGQVQGIKVLGPVDAPSQPSPFLSPGMALDVLTGQPVKRDLAAETAAEIAKPSAGTQITYAAPPAQPSEEATPTPQEEPMITMVSPGGSSPSKWVERVSPQAKEAYKKAFEAQEATIRKNAGDKESAALQERDQAGRASQEMRDRSAQEEARANAVQKEAEQKIETERARIDEISKENAADSYDKDRFWSDMSTPRKIGLSLSTFLSGFVSGATGKPNRTLEYLEKLVDQDIKQQQDALNARRAMRGEKIASAKTAIELAQRQFPTAEAQRSAAKASAMEAIKMDLTRQLANTRSVEERAKGEEMLAALEGKRAEYVNQTMQFMQGSSSPALYRVKGKVGLYTGQQVDQQVQKDKELLLQYGDKSNETARKDREEARKDREEARQESAADVVMPGGETLKIYDTGSRDKLRETVALTNDLIESAERIKEIIGNSPTIDPSKAEEIKMIQNKMMGTEARLSQRGVINPHDQEPVLESTGGDPLRWNVPNAIKAMNYVQTRARRGVYAHAASFAQPDGKKVTNQTMPQGAVRAGGGR